MSDFLRSLEPTEKQFIYLIVMSSFIIISVFIVLGFLVYKEGIERNLESNQEYIKNSFYKNKQELLKNEVGIALKYSDYYQRVLEKRLKKDLKEHVDKAHAIATNIYNDNVGKQSDTEIQRIIVKALEKVSFFDGRGYYFINTNQGRALLWNKNSQLDTFHSVIDYQDKKGTYIIKKQINIVKSKGEGFTQHYFSKPDDLTHEHKKITYVKNFSIYDWHFGAGDYVEDFSLSLKEEILNYLSDYRFGANGYFFVYKKDGTYLIHNGKRVYEDLNLYKEFPQLGKTILKVADEDGEFVKYRWNKLNSAELIDKLSYVVYDKEFDWIIGGGVYIDDLETLLEIEKEKYMAKISSGVQVAISVFTLFTIFFLLFTAHFINKLLKIFRRYKSTIEGMTKDLQKSNQNLEIKVEERTEELEKANNLKTKFIANISHEIKTPVNSILGCSQILEERTTDRDSLDLIDSVKNSSKALVEILDNVLDISKHESKLLEVQESPVSISKTLFEIKDEFEELIKKKSKVDFRMEIPTTAHYRVLSDKKILKKVIRNILSNALKFTESGFVSLGCFYHKYNERCDVLIVIEDSGIGMKEEDSSRELDVFEQLDMNDNRRFNGIGLGVYLSKKLISLIGGEIVIDSKENIGTKVTIELKALEIFDEDDFVLQEEKNSDAYSLTSSEISRLKEINALYLTVKSSQSFDEYYDFGQTLLEVSQALRSQVLEKISISIINGARTYNLDEIEKNIHKYERFIDGK